MDNKYLRIEPDSSNGWRVQGVGFNFSAHCDTYDQAHLVAIVTRQEWHPDAEIIHYSDWAEAAEERRYRRMEKRDEMRGDWNE